MFVRVLTVAWWLMPLALFIALGLHGQAAHYVCTDTTCVWVTR